MNKNHAFFYTLLALMSALFIQSKSFAVPAYEASFDEKCSYYNSGAYLADLKREVSEAAQFLNQYISHHDQKKHKFAIVLDIDETSLSNYSDMKRHHFSANQKMIEQQYRAAHAHAITPMLAFYREAQQHGVAVFFVTGRSETFAHQTEKNLKKEGYAGWAHIYYMPKNTHPHSMCDFKTPVRAEIEKQGYTIIASVGDQRCDYAGGHTLKGFKLPNPFYFVP